MFKSTTTYYVGANDYLDKVFKNGVLPNGFIDKGRCGIGGTTMEINNKERSSIIVVPTVNIIENKHKSHPELYQVYEKFSEYHVQQYLAEMIKGQKIMTTPEGIVKIMKAAVYHGRLNELVKEWFLMLDEAHSFITEDFRDGILRPFDYFWGFDNKCIISATPYYFSDPRMNQLDLHKVNINGKLGEITLVKSKSVAATLDYIIKHKDEFPANIHIFYNSVTETAKALVRSGVDDCNIYCADDKQGLNKRTLGDLWKHHSDDPDTSNFKKLNFYTSKCFEGWDMHDENATLILVTDVHSEHTKIGIRDKGIQAFGRLRGKKGTDESPKPYQLIHITNSLYNDTMKSHPDIVNDFTYNANYLIKQNNDYVSNPNISTVWDDKRLLRFATVDDKTKLATLNYMKLDQYINEASTTEVYNNFKFIQQAWQKCYTVDPQYSDIKLETATTMKRKSKSAQFKEDYETLLTYKHNRSAGIINWNIYDSVEQNTKLNNPLAWEAVQLLDEQTVEDLKYSPSKIKQEVIIKGNEDAEGKLLKLLDSQFKVGRFYTNTEIEAILTPLYVKLMIRNKQGEIKPASASHLGEKGRFEIKKDKKKDSQGNWVHGYLVLRKQFQLTIAA